ncbi:MAG: branched-chain amino acid ABC transporter permease [Burkholderiaceae bacterium]|nr:branched-chain amino acid ABC transporter permease [Burkholderiaceae bacterium]
MTLLPEFFRDALLLGGLYCLMAVGLALAFGVTRIINFAHGEMIMLGAYGAYFLSNSLRVDPLLSLPLVAIGVALIGWLIFKLALERALDAPHINQILLLFGVGLIIQNLAALAFTGDERSVTTSYSLAAGSVFDVTVPYGRLIAFAVSMVLTVALILWLRFAELGRAIRAVAQRRDAALLMGIDVNRMYMLSFMVSAALGAATGAMVSFLLTISPFMGFHMLIKGFAIVVLGGLGSIGGTLIAAFLLAFAETGVAYYVHEGGGWAEGVALVVLLVVLILRPRGILGQAVDDE